MKRRREVEAWRREVTAWRRESSPTSSSRSASRTPLPVSLRSLRRQLELGKVKQAFSVGQHASLKL